MSAQNTLTSAVVSAARIWKIIRNEATERTLLDALALYEAEVDSEIEAYREAKAAKQAVTL